jgi:PhoH-like ATPase
MEIKTMKKTFVLDTNVLMADPSALSSFEDNNLVIPLIVLEELDRNKDRQDDAGWNARESSRKLSMLLKENENTETGVPLNNGGKLWFLSINDAEKMKLEELEAMPQELPLERGDNIILAFCRALKKTHLGQSMVLVTRDLLLRVKAKVMGINAEDYKKLQTASSVTDVSYTGMMELDEPECDISLLYQQAKETGYFELKTSVVPYVNQFVHLKQPGTNSSLLSRYLGPSTPESDLGKFKIVQANKVSKLDARNREQRFAIDLLLDPKVKLVTISGFAGTGKSILAIAAGLQQVLETPKIYRSLIVCRPVQPVGRDIGFLPGTVQEKLEPWVAPIKDNLRYLISQDGKKSKNSEISLDMYFDEGTIEVEAMSFIRGRSIANAFMLIDECQNLNLHEIKTILTRAGEGTKIVLTGDTSQIDNLSVDSRTNGLSVVIEHFKNKGIYGHVQLIKGERSELATICATVLG